MERHRAFAERSYAALNHRDFAAFLDGVAEDVEFRSLIAEAEGDTFHGHDGVRQWWTRVVQALGGLGFEMEDYAEDGNALVTKVRVRGSVGATGIEQAMWQGVLVGDDDKAVWWQTFRDEDEAWAAVRERLAR
jgi:ketosteroid isomerase-like protein